MKRKLPPFASVRAFEAAARHQSFKAAAEELHVTQSAISHQVKGLEEFLDASLFHRDSQGVTLSAKGIDYFRDVSLILDKLDAATERMTGTDVVGQLSVCSTPAFASRWLVPRMERFNNAYPEIELQITTTNDSRRFPDEDIDVLIQYGQEPEAGLRVDPFLSTTRFPVCSPGFLEKKPNIRSPEGLKQATLLSDMVGDDWESWFECTGTKIPKSVKRPRFSHCELTMRAAEEGQGVALAYGVLIADAISNNKLVKLFESETVPKVLYSLTCPEGRINHPRTAAFRNWIFSEAALNDQNAIH